MPPGEFALLTGPGADITLIRTAVIGNLTWFPAGVQKPLQVDGGVVRVDAQAGDAFGVILAGAATPSPFPLVGLTLSQGVDPDYTLSWREPSTASVLYFGPPTGMSASTQVGLAPAYSEITIQGAFLRTDGTVVLTPPFSQWVRPVHQLWR